MDIHLDGKTAEMVRKLANSMGMSEDAVVRKILEWYFEDSEK